MENKEIEKPKTVKDVADCLDHLTRSAVHKRINLLKKYMPDHFEGAYLSEEAYQKLIKPKKTGRPRKVITVRDILLPIIPLAQTLTNEDILKEIKIKLEEEDERQPEQ